jgi:hypothetical protein
MFLRFVVHARDDRSDQQRGIFTELYRLEREGQLTEPERAWFSEVEAWFNAHLAPPERLQRSARPGAPRTAVTWLKASAIEHITRMRTLVALLEHKDIVVEELVTDRPGYIVYEDDFQVAAQPFTRETF